MNPLQSVGQEVTHKQTGDELIMKERRGSSCKEDSPREQSGHPEVAPDMTEVPVAERQPVPWGDMCQVASFSLCTAWILILVFNDSARMFSGELPRYNECLLLFLFGGAGLALLFSGLQAKFMNRVLSHMAWPVAFAVSSVLLHTALVVLPAASDSAACQLALAGTLYLCCGALLAPALLYYCRRLASPSIENPIALSVLTFVIAVSIYLVAINLFEPAEFVMMVCLPLLSALLYTLLGYWDKKHGSGATPILYTELPLFQRTGGTKASVSTPSRVLTTAMPEKALGMFTWGLSIGVSLGICLATLASVGFGTSAGYETVIPPLLMTVSACALLVSLKLITGRSFLRLPQWSFYVVIILAMLLIPLSTQVFQTHSRVLLSSLVLASGIYFLAFDLFIMTRESQDRSIDPIRLCGILEGIFFVSIVAGWLLFLLFDRHLQTSDGFTYTYVPLIVTAVIALTMSLMRWLLFDSVLTGSASARLGEWERRCETMSIRYGLTQRESEILEMLVRGRSVNYIKDDLVISVSTAKTHVNNIYKKCGIHSKQELISLFEKERNNTF